MSRNSINLSPALEQYLLAHSLREPALLQELRARTSELAQANMQISPVQGQLMGLLAKLINAKKVIEVGTFTGYSALSVAEALPEDGQLIACDVSEDWTSIAQEYWARAGVQDKITLKLAPAAQTLDELLAAGHEGSFDMAFIDADKSNYATYYERCLKLLRPGGIVLVDNVLWGGQVCDEGAQDEDTKAIRALNALIHQDERVEMMSMLPVGDGLTIARKR